MGHRLSVVLITWNSEPYMERCCAGIRVQSPAPDEIVLIDNGSEDQTVERVETLLPEARIVRNETNRGFAAAANQGIEATTGDWVLLANPDLHLDSGYTDTVIRAIEDVGPKCGSGTGKLLQGAGYEIEPTGRIDSKGIRMTRSGRHFDIAQGELDDGVTESSREVFGVSGAAAVYRRSFVEDAKIEGQVFDEDFFTYREDADLSWRGQLLGWTAVYVPSANGWHVRTVTPVARKSLTPMVNMHSVKNRFLLRLKNEGAGLAFRHAIWELPRDLIVLGAALTVERTSLPAFGWLWQHRAAIMAKRRQIQSRRSVPDAELARWFD